MDSDKTARIRLVLEKMQVQREKREDAPPPVFVLGSFCRRVTFYSQQVRGFNAAYALMRGNVVSKAGKVAVIGAGAAGIAAAAGLLKLGAKVTLIDRQQNAFSRQLHGHHRELHPHIYDWPDAISENANANLPLLTWRANDASSVVDDVRVAWKAIATQAASEGQLREVMSSIYLRIERAKQPVVSWQLAGEAQTTEEFDAAILAVGFGEDQRELFGMNFESYWRPDRLDLPAEQDILISGAGDGGLLDLVRSVVNLFDQRKIVARLKLNHPDMARTRESLLRIEEGHRKRFDGPEMASDYEQVFQQLPQWFKAQLDERDLRRGDRTLYFHTKSRTWLDKNTSILNRFLAFLLIRNNPKVRHRWGVLQDIARVSREGIDKFKVKIEGNDPFEVDQAVIRWGAVSEFEKSETLSLAIGSHRDHFETFGYDDPTIVPLWDGPEDFDVRPDASASPVSPLPGITSQDPGFRWLYHPGTQPQAVAWFFQFASLQRVATPPVVLQHEAIDGPPWIVWRPAVRGVLAAIEQMADQLEERVRLHVRLRFKASVDPSETQYLISGFLDRRDQLHQRLHYLTRGYELFWQATRDVEPDVRIQGARNYAAFANLYLLCWLYRFRGRLIDEEGGLVLRTFADAPPRDEAIYTMPILDKFAMDAFPQFAGMYPEFVHAKLVCRKSGAREFITLPKFVAYSSVGQGFSDDYLLHTWILPQWALRHSSDLPTDGVLLDRISDDRGREWFSRHEPCPWDGVEWVQPEPDGIKLGRENVGEHIYTVEERVVPVPAFSHAPAGEWYYLRGVWRPV